MKAHRRIAELEDKKWELGANGLRYSDEYAAVVAELREFTEERFTKDPNLSTFFARVKTGMDGTEIVFLDAATWRQAREQTADHFGVPEANVRQVKDPTEEQLDQAFGIL